MKVYNTKSSATPVLYCLPVSLKMSKISIRLLLRHDTRMVTTVIKCKVKDAFISYNNKLYRIRNKIMLKTFLVHLIFNSSNLCILNMTTDYQQKCCTNKIVEINILIVKYIFTIRSKCSKNKYYFNVDQVQI